jgi:hypothetical protein
MLLWKFAWQQKHGLNAILSKNNLIQAMRILGPLLTFTQLDHQQCTETIKSVLFMEILLPEALERRHVKRVKRNRSPKF